MAVTPRARKSPILAPVRTGSISSPTAPRAEHPRGTADASARQLPGPSRDSERGTPPVAPAANPLAHPPCVQCGNPLTRPRKPGRPAPKPRKGQICCSTPCRQAYQKTLADRRRQQAAGPGALPTRECPACRLSFRSERADQDFCVEAHRKAYNNALRRNAVANGAALVSWTRGERGRGRGLSGLSAQARDLKYHLQDLAARLQAEATAGAD